MLNEKEVHSFWDGLSVFERNRFYFGKMMTVRDFTDEQGYLNQKRWLINRLGIGWGVLSGLNVTPCQEEKGHVRVDAGVALDPLGHEILVCNSEVVNLTAAMENDGDTVENNSTTSHDHYLFLQYRECQTHPSPVVVEDCEGYHDKREYNRIHETYRFIVTKEKPNVSNVLSLDSTTFLEDFSALYKTGLSSCPQSDMIPIAKVCYNEESDQTLWDIDMSLSFRKMAFSNELLYSLIDYMYKELWQSLRGGNDRSQFVPLLASTIKGLSYQDGKIKKLTHAEGFDARSPKRLTSDGDHIWITDSEAKRVWRIKRETGAIIDDTIDEKKSAHHQLDLGKESWGIAFDGSHMWITHHDAVTAEDTEEEIEKWGTLTRINVHTLERKVFTSLFKREDLKPCQQSFDSVTGLEPYLLKPLPGEVVLHKGHIYVAHAVIYNEPDGSEEELAGKKVKSRSTDQIKTYDLYLSRIDPHRGCLVECIEIDHSSDEFPPVSEILSMASDGDSLWLTYEGRVPEQSRLPVCAVVRKITTSPNPESKIPPAIKPSKVSHPIILEHGKYPKDMVFDGTHLWITHNDGFSRLDLDTFKNYRPAKSKNKGSDNALTAIAFSGDGHLWAAENRGNEASLKRFNIHTEDLAGEVEIEEFHDMDDVKYEITDIQYDGAYIFISAVLGPPEDRKGIIYRYLP